MPTTKVVGEENQKSNDKPRTTPLSQKSQSANTSGQAVYMPPSYPYTWTLHSDKAPLNMSKPFPLPRQENAKEPDRLEENPDSVKNTHSSAAPTHVTGWRTPSFAAVVEARRRFLNTRAARHVAAHGDRRGHLLGGTLWPRLSVPRETAVVRALAREKGEGGSP